MIFKRRGSIGSLRKWHSREWELIARVEAGIDSRQLHGAVLEEIIAEARSRAAAEPEEASWKFILGRYLMAAGSPEEALDALEEAGLLEPQDPRIAAHLGLWYESAFQAAWGDWSNVELPAADGPAVTSHVAAFDRFEHGLRPATLAARAEECFRAALRFSLPGDDVRFLRRHIKAVQLPQMEPSEPLPIAVKPLTRAG
jgi:hypothetical protein